MTTIKACLSGCTVEGCERPRKYRLYCNLHYKRVLATGEPGPAEPMVRRTEGDLATRLWARITVMPSGCWEYAGARNSKRGGYGRIYVGRIDGRHEVTNASRAAWIVTHGPVPAGMIVRHKCDNPPCFNPAHLELGTHADNTGDKILRGHQPRGEGNGAAKLTAVAVRDIRSRAALGEVQRMIAEDYNVTRSLVSMIVNRRIWKGVMP